MCSDIGQSDRNCFRFQPLAGQLNLHIINMDFISEFIQKCHVSGRFQIFANSILFQRFNFLRIAFMQTAVIIFEVEKRLILQRFNPDTLTS